MGLFMRKMTLLGLFGLVLTAVGFVCVGPVAAITIKIDYSRDTNGFFNASTTDGAAARSALNAAAAFYSDILEDTFSAIEVPTKTFGSKGGEATYFWKRRFLDPQTGLNDAEVNAEIDANEYVIYVGARDLPGNELGNGGPGGFVGGFVHRVGEFTSAEASAITNTVSQFLNASTKRGEANGFARWGGSIAFDERVWHFDHTTNPGAGQQDFYSVALHEMAHALGFGIVDGGSAKTPWEELVSGSNFTGTNAVASHGGSVPLASADDTGHWLQAIATSPIYEGAGSQTPLMVPTINTGLRRLLTNLDAAALADIGWEIDLPGGAAQALTFAGGGSSSGSASVAALSLGNIPEPGCGALAILALSALPLRRR
jgi:hypothetical protein